MNTKCIQKIVTMCLIAAMALGASAGDASKWKRSLIFPGVGQFSDNQQAKGLLFMGGEIALLSLAFVSLGDYNSHARQTEYCKVYLDNSFEESDDYNERKRFEELWQESQDKADKAQVRAIAFGGAAVGWWVLNVLDAMIFQNKNADEFSVLEKVKEHTLVSTDFEKTTVTLNVSF